MTTAREVKLRIQSVRNITQVTRALQAVSASRVRRAMQAVFSTRPYATKAWEVLTHLAKQPGREFLHPLLTTRPKIHNVIVVLISGDRGLAGAYNSNIFRFTAQQFDNSPVPVRFVAIGRRGRDMLYRRGKRVFADYSHLPEAPSFADVSSIGWLVVDEFLDGHADEVYLVYTDFVNMLKQVPTVQKLLPLKVDMVDGLREHFGEARAEMKSTYLYEPGREEILDAIVPRFTGLQVYQAILESQASEHAARMVAMKNATDNATELARVLQLEYNKARQQNITNEMLDIAGGAEALARASS
ncbi:MAG: ATP synthase F1 subunit gamma [Chloroflexota bacterium]